MPLKSVVEIDVDDSKFREFQRNFDAYSEALKGSSTPWAEIAKGTSDAAEALDKMVAKERDANAIAKLTAFAKGRALEIDREQAAAKARADYAALSRMEKLGKGARDFATRMSGAVTHWKGVTGQAKETEARVASVTRLMSGWKALSLIGGLGGLGGSLYGLDRLAGSAAAGRRQSMGTGVPFGKQRAFSLDYSRFGDGDALMGAIGTAKGDATSQQYLGLLSAGISAAEIRAKDAADLGAELFDKLPGLFPRGANDPTFGSSFEARGLGSLLSQEDAKRYLNASPDERQAQRKAYEADNRSMAADPTSLRAWADLDSALGRAKDNIETALVTGLAPLAPQFTTLSGDVATLITDFSKAPEIKSSLESLASGLETVDKALKDSDSWWNKAGSAVKGVMDFAGNAGQATHSALQAHGLKYLTYDYWFGSGGAASGDAHRQLAWMGRANGLHGDRLKAFVTGQVGTGDGGSTGVHDPLKDLISQHETGGIGAAGYDTVYGHAERGGQFAPPKPITQMTIGEVLAYQHDMKARAGTEAFPVGRAQWVEKTLRGLTAGMDQNQVFTPELQEKLFDRSISQRMAQGPGGFRSEWASLGNVSDAEIQRAMDGRREAMRSAISQVAGDSPEVAEARRYLAQTATGAAVARGDSITKLNPAFALAAAKAIRQARAEGIPAGIFSGYRKPTQTGSNYDAQGFSGHSYGIASDFSGVGTAGSATSRRFDEIARAAGLGGYGPDNPREFNHKELGVHLQNDAERLARMRGTLGPNGEMTNPQATWTASGYVLPKGSGEQFPQVAQKATPLQARTFGGYIHEGGGTAQPPKGSDDVKQASEWHQSPLQYTKSDGANALTALYANGLGDKMHREIAKAYLSNPALDRARKDAASAKEGKTSTGYVNPIADHYDRQKNNPNIHVSNASGGNLHVSAIAGSY